MATSIEIGHSAFFKRFNRLHAPFARCASRSPNDFTTIVETWRLNVEARQISKNSAVLGEHKNATKKLYMRSKYIDHEEKGANINILCDGERVFASDDFAFKQRSDHVCAGSQR